MMNPNTSDFNIGVVAPLECLKEGWEAIKDRYWLFLGLALVAMLIGGAVPIVLIGPMMCGLYLCLFAQMRGQQVEFGDLFKGFDYFVQGLIAAAIQTVPIFIVLVPAYAIFFAFMIATMPHDRYARDQGPPAGFFIGVCLFVLVMLVVSMAIHLLFVFAYPLIGHTAHLGDAVFGLWAGIAINDTSQVVAASAAYSPGAFEVATVVKLIRNALMAPLLVAIGWAWNRRTGQRADTRAGLRRAIPVFVLGFLALSGLRSVGAIDAGLANNLEIAARALILVALSAIGLNLRVAELRSVGPKPLTIGLAAALVIGTCTILAIAAFGLANGLSV